MFNKLLSVPFLVAAPLAAASLPASAQPHVEVHRVTLEELNGSGVTGTAILIQRDTEVRAIVIARGLEPGQVHPQHIHGLSGNTNGTCPPPSAADDRTGLPEEAADPDEFISLEDGAPFYGPVLLPLTPFPTANRAGVVFYDRTFQVSGDLEDLDDEVVVLHGMTLAGGYAATLPVACGEID